MHAGQTAQASVGAAARTLGLIAVVTATGCGGANPSIGLEAYFRAAGAQFVEGALPSDANAVGPSVKTIASNNNRLYAGVQNKAVSGTVDSHGSAVAIGLSGDTGHWIVPVGGEDAANPPDLTFSTRGSFSPALPAGTYELVYRAVDRNGAMGPSNTQTLTLAATPADGTFVISLEWDGPADLDLHVVAPSTGGTNPADTVEVWSKKRDSLASRSLVEGPFTPEELAAAGRLDFDSNSGCVYDGRNDENVIWTQAPPPGHYIVRVDASSLCGAGTTRWRATAFYQGDLQAEVFGQLGDAATATPHVAGAGLTVLELNVM
jgi:hypothetical protein